MWIIWSEVNGALKRLDAVCVSERDGERERETERKETFYWKKEENEDYKMELGHWENKNTKVNEQCIESKWSSKCFEVGFKMKVSGFFFFVHNFASC